MLFNAFKYLCTSAVQNMRYVEVIPRQFWRLLVPSRAIISYGESNQRVKKLLITVFHILADSAFNY